MGITLEKESNNLRVNNKQIGTISKFCSRLTREIEGESQFSQLAVFTVDIWPNFTSFRILLDFELVFLQLKTYQVCAPGLVMLSSVLERWYCLRLAKWKEKIYLFKCKTTTRPLPVRFQRVTANLQ